MTRDANHTTSSGSLLESVKTFALKRHYYDLKKILLADDCDKHYTVLVHAMSLFEFDVEFAYCLFKNPEFALENLDHAFRKAAKDIMDGNSSQSSMTYKENIRARMTELPACPEIYRTVLPTCSDINQFLCLTGTVTRVTVPKMMEYRKTWKCTKCKFVFNLDVKPEDDFMIVKPTCCENPERCYNKAFTLVSTGVNAAWCKDYQEMRMQEQVYNLVIGTVPRSMWVVLEGDLVDSCQAGNDVIISGIVKTRWQPLVKSSRSDIELIFIAHNVEVKNNNIAVGSVSEDILKEFKQFWQSYHSNPLRGRDFILSCFCPQVFGLYIVKLAVSLVLAGGVQRVDHNNTKIRGDSHLLLVGDPGTGKSQFLKYASKVSRRSVLTSGIGTTNAGLTAAAVKDGGKWQLEAGALILADGGICCIDEFNSIKEADKASIHEAMEQQTISVAKAGLVCKLSTQCSILAATNPKGKYNKNESLSTNTAMASPLLSRFDIIIVLLDTNNEDWDQLVSSYILQGKDIALENGQQPVWSMDKMRTYFSIIKNIRPKLTSNCDRILQVYYRKQRSMVDRSAARTTPRLLQSLVRLAQGHARLMFRLEVTMMDAIVAISVMESSMQGSGLFYNSSALHSTFPEDPEKFYWEQAAAILKELDLEDILEDETAALNADSSRNAVVREILTQINPHPYYCIQDDYDEELMFLRNGSCSETCRNEDIFEDSPRNMTPPVSTTRGYQGSVNVKKPSKTLSSQGRILKQREFSTSSQLDSQPAQRNKSMPDISNTAIAYLEECLAEFQGEDQAACSTSGIKRKSELYPNSSSQRKKTLFCNDSDETHSNKVPVSSQTELFRSCSDERETGVLERVSEHFVGHECETEKRVKKDGASFSLRKRNLSKRSGKKSNSDDEAANGCNESSVSVCVANNLSNDVSTLSQLNRIFDTVLVDLDEQPRNRDSNNISHKLKGFAFKPQYGEKCKPSSSSEENH